MNKPFHLTLLAATLSMAAFTATAAETQVVAADATTNEAEEAKSSRFFIPFDRQGLADYLSVDRSALSAELGRLRDDGVLNFRKNQFEFL